MAITDEYVDAFITTNTGRKIKNLTKPSNRLITVSNRNKKLVKLILIENERILEEIKQANIKISEKTQEIKTKRNRIKLIEELKINVPQLRPVQPILQPQRDGEPILSDSLFNKQFQRWRYNYININDLRTFYNVIVAEMQLLGNTNYVAIGFKSLTENKIIFKSILSDRFRTFEDFQENVNQFTVESVGGSDVTSTEQYTVAFDVFSIYKSDFLVGSKSEDMLFEVEGIETKDFTCGFECLKKCGVKFPNNVDKLQFRSLQSIIDFIKINKLEISVIANAFTTNKLNSKILERGETVFELPYKKSKRKYVCGKLKDEDINLIYLFEAVDNKFTIVFDEVNQHVDLIKNNKITLQDNVYISLSSNVIKGEKIIFTPKQMNTNNLRITETPVEYLFFDFETVIDFKQNSCMSPYSLSILRLNPDELKYLEDIDKNNKIEEVGKLRKTNCLTFLGFDCCDKFIEWFLKNQNDKMFVFVGFNNSNFDNFILLDALLQYKVKNPKIEYSINEEMFNGSQLLNFNINGRHNMFDIRKHLVGSLKDNCKSFSIKCCSKKSFDHNLAQKLFGENKLIDFITNNEELKEYNEFDVLATAVLYQRYCNALSLIPATKRYAKNLFITKTIGSLIYSVFKDSKEQKGYSFPELDYQTYSDLQKHKVAGRVELFNGVQKITDRMVSTDVCSLYPYVLSVAPVYYPCGDKTIDVDTYKGDDVLGFYYCDIDQSILRTKNLPNIYPEKLENENDWNSNNILKDYLISNVMIGLLRKNQCVVNIKKGFIFTDKKKSCDMFDFILDLMSAKNEEDKRKDSKDPAEKELYNPALRETYKLLMNALTGKVIEGLHTEQTKGISTGAEYLKTINKADTVNFINIIGNKMYMTFEIDEEKLIKKQRPIFLGILIYDYAKRYMYEYSYSKIGKDKLFYTDTDASKFRYKDFITWNDWIQKEKVIVPHWKEVELKDKRYKDHLIYQTGSKVFGSFEDELEKMKGDEYVFYCLEKKSWLYATKKDDKFDIKYKFKGLNGKAQILTLEEDFVREKIITHKNGDIEYKYNIKEDKEEAVYNYYNENVKNNIESDNEIKFFENLYTTGVSYVLTSNFRKIVKNTNRNVRIEDDKKYQSLFSKIQVNYLIKKIQIRKI